MASSRRTESTKCTLLMVTVIWIVQTREASSNPVADDDILEVREINKSENDHREYKYLTLKNDLRVLLVSDPSTEKAAAAVSINAGYSSDPPEVPGIAHFCEHMLFLGTEKYPLESGFGKFLSHHNGRTNAYTSSEYTVYHFDINAQSLAPALDRFAQFFLSPTFAQSATDRELHAVDQEHQKNILDDSRRIFYIDRASAKPGHRYGAFGTGNLETLETVPAREGIDVRKKLLEFHDKYYSANIMRVVVMGNESIEGLQNMTVPLFKDVNNTNVDLTSFEDNLPYGENELGVMLKIPTVKEMSRLELKFQIFDTTEYYESKPGEYLSQVIGHEGKGSLLSLLKEKGWAYALWAGDRGGLKGFAFFIIGMDLTKDGLEHTDDIIGMTFQYIKMLRQKGPEERIYNEMRVIDTNRFRFKDIEYPRRYVQTLAKDMHTYAPQDTLYGHYKYGSFRPHLITDIVHALTPRNFRYFICSKTFENDTHNRKVKYFDAEYTSIKIPEWKIKTWENVGLHDHLHLPYENQFIPESLDVVVPREDVEEKAVPTLIKDNELSRVWHKADDTFFVPKTSIKIIVTSPYASSTPSNLNHMSVFIRLVRDAMVEYGYDAQLANIRYSLRWLFTGFLVTVDGFSSKQGILLEAIFHKLTNLHIKKEKFDLIKQQLLESLNNMKVHVPYRQTEELRNYVVNEKTWSGDERLKYMDQLTVESIRWYIPAFLNEIYIESLFCGNILQEEALGMHNMVEDMLIEGGSKAMAPILHMKSRDYKLPHGDHLYEKRSRLHSFSAVQLYMQVGLQNERNNILCELFWHMIHLPMFAKLRTQEQLGYIVFSGLSRSHSVQGIRVQVQSDKPPSLVYEKIDTFFRNFSNTLNNMTDKVFNTYVKAATGRKLEKPKRLGHEASIYAMEIFIKQYHFRRGVNEAKALEQLTIEDIKEFYKKYIDPSSPHRRKLVIVVLGRNENSITTGKKKDWVRVKDVLSFKSGLPLYQLLLPYNNISLLSYKEARSERRKEKEEKTSEWVEQEKQGKTREW